ncbi:MAG: LLM class flavin-dependent oxidoreductase [Gammaproteobacteria bacterium]|nr:LLM class flavin-dependent oxidoreductase [Gammaproteobacteria bacterium]
MHFGLNRLDMTSPAAFAEDARRLESLGWDYGFIPSSPLLARDPYVMLAAALQNTTRIRLGPLIENPIMRQPAVIAGSIATVDALAPGRVWLGIGVGDTAVRLMGRKPATVAELAESVQVIRRLLAGERLEVGAARPARLRHAAPVPVWIAAGGPRTLRMAGAVADGVFIRVGVHRANLVHAVGLVREGAEEAGRKPASVGIGCVFHTVLVSDSESPAEAAGRVGRIGRAIAAGYYEYSPMLFDTCAVAWNGVSVAELKRRVWPDFHHARDLEAAGDAVAFLGDDAVDAFALHGDADAIIAKLREIESWNLGIDIVVPHPMPTEPTGPDDYTARFARDVLPAFR